MSYVSYLRDVPAILKFAQDHQKTIFLRGGTGLGKTQIIEQCADAMFPMEKLPNQTTNYIYILLSDKDPTDLTGVQFPETFKLSNGETGSHAIFARPSFIPKDPNWQGVVFFDELSNANIPCQQAAYQAMLEHTLGDYHFNDKCVFVAAGNRECDNGGTHEILRPLANRMVVIDLEYSLENWIEDYAVPHRVHPAILGYLKGRPAMFYTGAEKKREEETSLCTPRSWVTVSDVMYDLDKNAGKDGAERLAHILIDGCLSKGVGSEFLNYYKRTYVLPASDDILKGKVKNINLKEEEVDLVYVCLQGCLHKLAEYCKDNLVSDQEIEDMTCTMLDFVTTSFTNQADIITGHICTLTGAGSRAGNSQVIDKNFFEKNNRSANIVNKVLKRSTSLITFINRFMKEFQHLVAEANS